MTIPASIWGDCRAWHRWLYSSMKTAISLPDHLFRAGDALAKRLKVSRSELYARALGEYLAKHRPDQVTQRLNAVYATEDSSLDPSLGAVQARSLHRADW
jgi:antitoxin MazE6